MPSELSAASASNTNYLLQIITSISNSDTLGIILTIITLAILVLTLVSLAFVFKKMGNKRYEAFISGHNLFILITKAGKPGRRFFIPVFAWLLVATIPSVGIIIGASTFLIFHFVIAISFAYTRNKKRLF